VRASDSPMITPVGQRGSGTLLGLAVLCATVLLGSAALTVTTGFSEAIRVQMVANQVALQVSDVSRGLVPGHPCPMASTLAASAGLRLTRCDVEGGDARVVVAGSWWGMGIEKRARAGPPGHPFFPDGG